MLMSVQFNRCGREGGVVLYRVACLLERRTEVGDMVKNMCENTVSADNLCTLLPDFRLYMHTRAVRLPCEETLHYSKHRSPKFKPNISPSITI